MLAEGVRREMCTAAEGMKKAMPTSSRNDMAVTDIRKRRILRWQLSCVLLCSCFCVLDQKLPARLAGTSFVAHTYFCQEHEVGHVRCSTCEGKPKGVSSFSRSVVLIHRVQVHLCQRPTIRHQSRILRAAAYYCRLNAHPQISMHDADPGGHTTSETVFTCARAYSQIHTLTIRTSCMRLLDAPRRLHPGRKHVHHLTM